MRTLREIRTLRRLLRGWRRAGETVALVPTMGNLHDGHLSLMTAGSRRADRVVATIFVNPTQFGPNEDYQRYPRTLAADQRKLKNMAVDVLFAPEMAEIYPRGEGAATMVSVPLISKDLCGRFRPTHFDGVTSVVCRLFNIVMPDLAVFGEKDYQQLVILRTMVADLHLPIRIIGSLTVREADGLAMSSRNQYLNAPQRRSAPRLYQALLACREQLLAGERNFRMLEAQGLRRLRKAGFRPEYFAIREAETLALPRGRSRLLRALAAARLGRARLIDNVAV